LYLLVIYVRPQDFLVDIKGWPIVSWLAGISIAVVFLEGGLTAEKFKRSKVNTILLLFLLALCMSHLANFWLTGAIQTFERFSKVVVTYFLIVFTCISWRRIKILMWALVLMSTFLAVQAIVQIYTGYGLVGGEALLRGEGEALLAGEGVLQARGIGIFEDPNDLALNIVPMIAFVLPAFHKGVLSRTWLTGLIFMIPMVTGVIYTRSRGGILGMAAVAWFYLHKRVGKVVAIGGVFVLFSILMAIPRMSEIDTQEASARGRLDHWSYGLGLLKQHPLFGVGVDRFTDDYSHTAHNSFVLVVAEAGFMGGFLWLSLFYATFREIKYMRDLDRGPPFLDEFADCMVGALVGWLVCAFFLSQTYMWLSYILMGLVVAAKNPLVTEDGVDPSVPFGLVQIRNAGILTVGAIVFMHIALLVMWSMS
jgi:O-antigen ligase